MSPGARRSNSSSCSLNNSFNDLTILIPYLYASAFSLLGAKLSLSKWRIQRPNLFLMLLETPGTQAPLILHHSYDGILLEIASAIAAFLCATFSGKQPQESVAGLVGARGFSTSSDLTRRRPLWLRFWWGIIRVFLFLILSALS